MNERRSTLHTEDIELDETGAEAVIGRVATRHITAEQAFKGGLRSYRGDAPRHPDEEHEDG